MSKSEWSLPQDEELYEAIEYVLDEYEEEDVSQFRRIQEGLEEEYGWSDIVAAFHAGREVIIRDTVLDEVRQRFADRYFEPVYEEDDLENLVKDNLKGKTEIFLGYSAVATSIGGLALGAPSTFYLPSAAVGVYLVNKGEAELIAAERKLDELAESRETEKDRLTDKGANQLMEDLGIKPVDESLYRDNLQPEFHRTAEGIPH